MVVSSGLTVPGSPGPKKLKRPNLAISSFKKGQILKFPSKHLLHLNLEFHKMFEICSDFSKTGLKLYYFCQHSKKAKKWTNGQTILFLANTFKKVKWQPWTVRTWSLLFRVAIQTNFSSAYSFTYFLNDPC